MNFMKGQIIKVNGKSLVRYIPKNSFLTDSIIEPLGSMKLLSSYTSWERVLMKIKKDKPNQISICPLQ